MGNSSGNIERLKKMRRSRWICLVSFLAVCLYIIVSAISSACYFSGVKSTMNKAMLDEPYFKLLDLIIGSAMYDNFIVVALIAGLGMLVWKVYTNFAIVAEEIENIKSSIRSPESESEQKEPTEK